MTEAGMGSTVSDRAGVPEGGEERAAARMREQAPAMTRGPGGGPEVATDRGAAPAAGGGTPSDRDRLVPEGRGAREAQEAGPAEHPEPERDPDGTVNGPVDEPEAVVDLVLDMLPDGGGGVALGAASAAVSVPSVGTAPHPAAAVNVVPAEGPGLLLGSTPTAKPGSAGSAGGDAVGAKSGLRPDDELAGPGAGAGAVPVAARIRPASARGTAHPSPAPSALASPLPSPSRHRDIVDRTRVGGERSAGRRHVVIGSESTATIPVHLLFRDDPGNVDGTGLPTDVLRRGRGGGSAAPGVRRPPAPRGPQVRPSTRPAPAGDPELAERPGPALPGWVALFTALIGLAGAGAVLWWIGALPATALTRFGIVPRPYAGIGVRAWAALAALGVLVLLALGGLSRGRVGYAWVLTLFGKYRGSVRRTGLMWISPLLLRRRVDVRLRHWRSEPLPAVDANGTALRVVVLVVWRVRDTARALLGVEEHETYLREQVEAAMARVLSQLPADAFHEDAPTLRDAEAVGDALTRMLKADCVPVGIEVYSAQPTGIEYAPEVAAAMQRRRIAAIDAQHRDSVLTSVVDAVDDTVNRLTERGIVELDDYERKVLVKDLTVAFYTGRSGGEGG
ncbi:SPFH domain-containing protein [Streptomyces sp. NPDC052042]|uniref:SPFH domain-containing protein n=1 Tax=Streptomyces sp. NPDC052042 TaxID=3365683 RepID=UPI0037D1260B